jgi:hypothetical protein
MRSADEVYVFVRARIIEAFDPLAIPQKVAVSVVRSNGVTLGFDEAMTSGDKYFILLESTRPTWFYVHGRDAVDKRQRYFPSGSAGKQTEPLRHLRIPVDETRFLRLDNSRGMERLYIVASDKRDTFLEKLKELPEGKPEEAKLLLVEELRGSYVELQRKDRQPTPIPMQKDAAKAFISFEHK